MTIKKTLLITFSAVTLLILALLSASIYTIYNSKVTTIQLIHDHEVSRAMADVSVTAQEIRRFETEYFLYFGEEKSQEMLASWNTNSDAIMGSFKMLEMNLAACGQAGLIPSVIQWKQAFNVYRTEFNNLNEAINNGSISSVDEAKDYLKTGHASFQVLLDGASNTIEDMFASAQNGGDQARESLNLFLIVTVIISAISACIAIASTLIIPKSISTPINQLTEITTLISKGQANTEVNVDGTSEIIELSKSVERLRVSTFGLFDRLQAQKDKYDNLRNKIIEAKRKRELAKTEIEAGYLEET